MLFEVAIIKEPTKKEKEEGGREKLVFGPKAVIANDDKSAGVVAVLECQKEIKISPSKMRILVRPF